MCSINWTKSRGQILFHKILPKRSPWALKDEEPCLLYCKDTPNSLGGMPLLDIVWITHSTDVILALHTQPSTVKIWTFVPLLAVHRPNANS